MPQTPMGRWRCQTDPECLCRDFVPGTEDADAAYGDLVAHNASNPTHEVALLWVSVSGDDV